MRNEADLAQAEKPNELPSATCIWPGAGKEVVVFAVGPSTETTEANDVFKLFAVGPSTASNDVSKFNFFSRTLPRTRPADILRAPPHFAKTPSHPSSNRSRSHPESGGQQNFQHGEQVLSWSGKNGDNGRMSRSLQGFNPKDSHIAFFTCPRLSQDKTTLLTCSSMPSLPSVLTAYRARVDKAAHEGLAYQTLRDERLPALQRSNGFPEGRRSKMQGVQTSPTEGKSARRKANMLRERRERREAYRAKAAATAKSQPAAHTMPAQPNMPQEERHRLPDISCRQQTTSPQPQPPEPHRRFAISQSFKSEAFHAASQQLNDSAEVPQQSSTKKRCSLQSPTERQKESRADKYHDRYDEDLIVEFKEIDLDNNGKIDAGELTVYLERRGITVVPGIVRELLQELKQDTHADLVGVEDYIRLREIIQYRQGFTKREVETMEKLHRRFDHQNTGRLNSRELECAIIWLGFPTRQERPDGHFEHIDVEDMHTNLKSSGLTLQDFLQVMRRRREYDITCLSQLVNEYASEDGTIASTAAEKVLRRLGYCTANAACIEEYAAENKISAQGPFYFDDMYLILQTFRSCEGFLKSEIESFRHVFNSHDMDGSGAIGVVELGGILRAMGYRPDLDEQQRLLDEVDLDHSGEIDFDEFLKLCRRYREDEIHILEQSFQRCRTAKGANDGKVSSNGKLAASEIRVILPALGYARLSAAENKIVDDMAGIEGLDFRQCIELMRRLRTADSDDFREHHGFTPKEEVAWKQRFKSYSASKSILLQQELRSLVQDSYADLLAEREEREKVDEILRCHGTKHPAGSNFCDFLEVLRMIEDRQSHRVILMENEAAVSKGFSRIEVRDYRKMYKLCDCDASKDFQSKDVNALLKVFSSIVPMTPQTQDELRIIIQKCYSKKAVKEGKKLQFIEFLDLMAALTVAAQQAEETAPEAEDLQEDEPSA